MVNTHTHIRENPFVVFFFFFHGVETFTYGTSTRKSFSLTDTNMRQPNTHKKNNNNTNRWRKKKKKMWKERKKKYKKREGNASDISGVIGII